jgi:hypothetical protein
MRPGVAWTGLNWGRADGQNQYEAGGARLESGRLRTTSGFPDLAEYVPARDADAVARLRGQGAVIFGKTNPMMIAMDWQTYNPIFGTTNNPWDLTRTPGGSSGGPSTAGVTANLSEVLTGDSQRRQSAGPLAGGRW